MSRFSLQPTFDTLQYGKPRFASPFVIWSCLSLRGGGGRLLNKCLYGEVPPRSPSPYPFIYYLACEQAKCKPARRGKGKGNPFHPSPIQRARLQAINHFFLRKRYPFHIPSADEWCLFHIPSVTPLDHFTDPHDRFSYPFNE